ncbi:MAG: SCO family protein [Alteromonadaceae bacterium]|nr:MAG: SCO family protein [Alteromonadaceae bacterium]
MTNLSNIAPPKTPQQARGIRNTLIGIGCVMTLFMTMFIYKIQSTRILSDGELQANRAIVFNQPRIIKPFQLRDHHNKPFELTDIQGKWSLMYFGFTHCPDICPTTLADLNRMMGMLEDEYAEQVQVTLVSLDPARDTPEVLAQYVPYFNPSFIGVTGEFINIMQLTQNVNVAFNKISQGDDSYTIDHSSYLVLVNPRGHYHGFFKPPFEPTTLKLTLQSIISSY